MIHIIHIKKTCEHYVSRPEIIPIYMNMMRCNALDVYAVTFHDEHALTPTANISRNITRTDHRWVRNKIKTCLQRCTKSTRSCKIVSSCRPSTKEKHIENDGDMEARSTSAQEGYVPPHPSRHTDALTRAQGENARHVTQRVANTSAPSLKPFASKRERVVFFTLPL